MHAPTSTNTLEERVIQRNTYYTTTRERLRDRLRRRKSYIINFRVSEKELEILEELMEKRRTDNLSKVIREAITVYHGLLSGAKEVTADTIVIQSPIVNIVESKAESKAVARSESKININVIMEVVKLVEKLYYYRDTMYPLQRKLVEQLYRVIQGLVLEN